MSKHVCSVQSMFEMFRWKKEQNWKEVEENFFFLKESHRMLALSGTLQIMSTKLLIFKLKK